MYRTPVFSSTMCGSSCCLTGQSYLQAQIQKKFTSVVYRHSSLVWTWHEVCWCWRRIMLFPLCTQVRWCRRAALLVPTGLSTWSGLPGSGGISTDGSRFRLSRFGWVYWGIYIVWMNGCGMLADTSAYTFYASSSHIWPLFPSATSGVWASGTGGWLQHSAAAQDCVCPFGEGPATELGQRACFLWPSTMGITIPVPCEKIAAVHCRLLSPSQVTLGWGSCQGFIIFTSDKLSPCEIFSGAKERCKDHFWEWLLSSAVCVST